MKLWTLVFLSLTFLSFKTYSCEFRSSVKKVYSFSGPVTTALKELGLLSSSSLKGVSIFHPVKKEEMKGEFIAGGIFLSPHLLNQFTDALVFYDESRDLFKTFNSKKIQGIEIVSRDLIPGDVTEMVLKKISPYLEGCDSQMEAFRTKTKRLEGQLLSLLQRPTTVVFFLGEYARQRFPEMLMVNDGVVKWLKDSGKIKTYPSELGYVSWSAKIMADLPKDTYKIMVKDSGSQMDKKITMHSKNIVSVVYPGGLIPGINQLEAWIYLVTSLKLAPSS